MGALPWIRLRQRLENQPISPVPDSDSLKGRTRLVWLRILTWLALFFVQEAQGDDVATALESTAEGVTLWVANSTGRPPDSEQDAASSRLLRAIEDAVDHRVHPISFMEIVFDESRHRIQHKLCNLCQASPPGFKDTDTTVDIITRYFNESLDQWFLAEGREVSKFVTDYAAGSETDPFNALKELFRIALEKAQSLRDTIHDQKSADPESSDAFAHFHNLCFLCSNLLKSTFLTALVAESNGQASVQDSFRKGPYYHWLIKVCRRLYRVSRYLEGAQLFTDYGVLYLRRILDGKVIPGQNLKIQWVGASPRALLAHMLPSSHNVSYQWPESPRSRLDSLLHRYGYEVSSDILTEVQSDLNNLWDTHNPITPHLHCEIHLLLFLRHHKIDVFNNLMGLSKPSCLACNIYFTQINMQQEGMPPWIRSETSGKAHPAWSTPPSPEGEIVVEVVLEMSEQTVRWLAEEQLVWIDSKWLGRRNENSDVRAKYYTDA